MALTWKPSGFNTEYAFLGRVEVGSVSWTSGNPRHGEGPGFVFRSRIFGVIPDMDEESETFPTQEAAKAEAEMRTIAYVDYLGRKTHGEDAWARVTKGL